MEGGVALTTLLMLLLLTPMAAGEKRGAITCTAVTTRSRTEVTCDFGQDISQSKRDFNVRFYYPDQSTFKYTPLMCNFLQDGGLLCQKGSDVIFNRMVSDQIQFISPAAVDKVGGQYVCQVAPHPPNTDIVPCNLTYTDAYREIPMSSPPATTPATNVILTYIQTNIALTTVVVVFLVLLSVALIFAVLFKLCQHRILANAAKLKNIQFRRKPDQETHAMEEGVGLDETDDFLTPVQALKKKYQRGKTSTSSEGDPNKRRQWSLTPVVAFITNNQKGPKKGARTPETDLDDFVDAREPRAEGAAAGMDRQWSLAPVVDFIVKNQGTPKGEETTSEAELRDDLVKAPAESGTDTIPEESKKEKKAREQEDKRKSKEEKDMDKRGEERRKKFEKEEEKFTKKLEKGRKKGQKEKN